MEHSEFKKLLFKSAVWVMACDGEIQEDEIKEIEMIARKTPYFKDMDCSAELKALVEKITKTGKHVIEECFAKIKETDFTPVQELMILEVLMRIINADKKIDPNEVKFLQIVRSKLKVHDEIIVERFGRTGLLFDKQYNSVNKPFKDDFFNKLKLPKLKDLNGQDIEIKMVNNK